MVNQIDSDSEMRDSAERLFSDDEAQVGRGTKRRLNEQAELPASADREEKRVRMGGTVNERVSQYEAMTRNSDHASDRAPATSSGRATASESNARVQDDDDYGLDDDDFNEAFNELEKQLEKERSAKAAVNPLKRKRDEANSLDDNERFTSRRQTGKSLGDEILIPDHKSPKPKGQLDYLTEKQFSERHNRPVSSEERNQPGIRIKTKDGGLVEKAQYAWTAKNFPEKGTVNAADTLAKDFERLGLNSSIPGRQKNTENLKAMVKHDGFHTAIDPRAEGMTTLAAAETQHGKGNILLRTNGGAYQRPEIIDRRYGNGASAKLFEVASGYTRTPTNERSASADTRSHAAGNEHATQYDPRTRESRGR